jgi:uncharacterized protein (TIGR02271 family)
MSTFNTAQAGYDARDKNHDGRVSMTEKVFDKGTYVDKDRNGFDDRDKNLDGNVSLKEKMLDRNTHGTAGITDPRDRDGDGHVSLKEKIQDKFSGHKTHGNALGSTDAAYTHSTSGYSSGSTMHGTAAPGIATQGAMMESQQGGYCNDLRCHGFSPCAQHPQAGTHHHHLKLAEEQLAIGKQEVAAGGVDIHKGTETHHVRETIPVKREEIVVERRPLSGVPDKNLTIDNQDRHITLPLKREEVVAEKVVVPKEEVLVHKKEIIDNQVVDANLRREFAELGERNVGAMTHDSRDLNRDGHVSMGENAAAATGLAGTTRLGHTTTGTGFASDSRDLNRDGHVSTGERAAAATGLGKGTDAAGFDSRDLNKDGHVSMGEKATAAAAPDKSQDLNHDGHVSLGEKIKSKLHHGRHPEKV